MKAQSGKIPDIVLTEEEKQLILAKRAKEELDRPKKTAKLKHDLYMASSYKASQSFSGLSDMLDQYVSKKDIDAAIKDVKDSFELLASKNTEFVCFIDEDGDQSWFDNDVGIEAMDEKWANQNLIDIKNL